MINSERGWRGQAVPFFFDTVLQEKAYWHRCYGELSWYEVTVCICIAQRDDEWIGDYYRWMNRHRVN